MGSEIERKYLVINDDWRANIVSQARLEQGYISDKGMVSVRVRISDDKAFLTIKTGKGITRGEFEYAIPKDDAEQLLKQAVSGACISKTRYKVKAGEHLWDLDVFDGDNLGLIMAEVELDDEEESFVMPTWAGEEVSADARYYNVNLVKHPFSQW